MDRSLSFEVVVHPQGVGVPLTQMPSGVQHWPSASSLILDETGSASRLAELFGRDALDWKKALGLPPVWATLHTICSDIASLPLQLLRRNSDGWSEAIGAHPLLTLLREPSDAIDGWHLRHTMQLHALLHGNGRAAIARDRNGLPEELLLLPPDAVTVLIYPQEQNSEWRLPMKWHVVFPEHRAPIAFPDEDVLHLYLMSHDGLIGEGLLSLAQRAMHTAFAANEYARKFFITGGVPSLILEAPPGVFRNEKDARSFLQAFNEYHAGMTNAHRVGLLREGVTAKVLAFNHRDAQMLEQRSFSAQEIMQLTGITVLPGVEARGTETERQTLYAQRAIRPWLRAWESELTRKLIRREEQETLRFAFNDWELVRPSLAERVTAYGTLIRNMVLTPNEVRAREGLPPLPGGDVLLNPSTTAFDSRDGAEANRAAQDAALPSAMEDATGPLSLAMAARLRPLMAAEGRRALAAYPRQKDWPAWVEQAYKSQQQRYCEVAEELGLPEEIGIAVAEQHRRDLLDCMTVGQVEHCVQNWLASIRDLSEQWTRQLLIKEAKNEPGP